MDFLLPCIFTIITILLFRINKRLYADILSPFSIFTFTWTLPLILSFFNLSAFQTGISNRAFCIIVGITILQYLLLSVSIPKSPFATFKITNSKMINECNISKLFLINGFFLITSFIIKIIIEFKDGIPLTMLLNHDTFESDLHITNKSSKLEIIAELLPYCSSISFYCLVYLKRYSLKWFLSLLFCLSPIILGILLTNKFDIIKPIVLYFSIFYYTKNNLFRKNKKKMLTAIVVLISIPFLITSIRIDGTGQTESYEDAIKFQSEKLPFFFRPLSSLLSYPYGYICLNFENCARYIDSGTVTDATGTSFLRPFLSLMMRGDIARDSLKNVDTLEVSGAANMGTYIRDLYCEGGIFMVVIGGVSYVLLIRLCYNNMILMRNFKNTFVYCSFIIPWMWLNFCNIFSVINTFSSVVIGYIIISKSRNK